MVLCIVKESFSSLDKNNKFVSIIMKNLYGRKPTEDYINHFGSVSEAGCLFVSVS